MKKQFLIIISILLMSILSGNTIDRIVAKVGKEIILESELNQRYEQYMAMQLITEEVTKEEVLEDMIESELIVIAAREQGIETDKMQMKEMAEQRIEELKGNYRSELEFRQSLKSETGMTPSELKDYFIDMMIEQKLKDEIINSVIKSKTHVTDSEVKEYYDDNLAEMKKRPEKDELGMILINVEAGEKTKSEALKKIMEINNKINKGDDFSELAKSQSDCPSSSQGGDLGFFRRGMMVKPFEDAAFELEPGEVSDIVETQFGYHIIMMEEKKDDQIRVRHILKKVEPTEEDRNKIIELVNKIKKELDTGADFSVLAKSYSMDESSADLGGVIGEFSREEYPELFKEEIEKLEYNEHSDVIQEGDSFYIFSKLRKIESRPYSYEELYDNLREEVLIQKQSEMYDRWINELKKETYIEVYL